MPGFEEFDAEERRKEAREEWERRRLSGALQAGIRRLPGQQRAQFQPQPQQQQQPAERQEQQVSHMPTFHPPHPITPGEQADVLGDMIDKTSAAWSNELDSRVAQAREERRMQHAKDIEAMRQEGLLRRLSAMQQPEQERPVASGLMRWFNPETGQWENTDRVHFG